MISIELQIVVFLILSAYMHNKFVMMMSHFWVIQSSFLRYNVCGLDIWRIAVCTFPLEHSHVFPCDFAEKLHSQISAVLCVEA